MLPRRPLGVVHLEAARDTNYTRPRKSLRTEGIKHHISAYFQELSQVSVSAHHRFDAGHGHAPELVVLRDIALPDIAEYEISSG